MYLFYFAGLCGQDLKFFCDRFLEFSIPFLDDFMRMTEKLLFFPPELLVSTWRGRSGTFQTSLACLCLLLVGRRGCPEKPSPFGSDRSLTMRKSLLLMRIVRLFGSRFMKFGWSLLLYCFGGIEGWNLVFSVYFFLLVSTFEKSPTGIWICSPLALWWRLIRLCNPLTL